MKFTSIFSFAVAALVPLLGLHAKESSLSKTDSLEATEQLWNDYQLEYRKSKECAAIGDLPDALPEKLSKEFTLKPRMLEVGEHKLPFVVLNKQPKSEELAPLYICMHGGGRNPKAEGAHSWPVNTREWSTQIQLAMLRYPKRGVFVVPRMADDRLGRWYHDLNSDAFDLIIEHAISAWGVDPNKVYLLGISEGGYGTDKLLPYMADRFAAGNSMAAGSLVKIGAQTTCENLRDTPIRTDIGGNDTMFNRIGLAKELHECLSRLEEANPGHYQHHLNIHPGKGHGGWDYGLGPVWLPQFTRDPLPKKLVWVTTPLQKELRSQFYWLGLDGEERPANARIEASYDRESMTVDVRAESFDKEGALRPLENSTLKVYLNDDMLDLDKAFTVTVNGKVMHSGKAVRRKAALVESLESKGDPNYIFPVILSFHLK